MNNLTQPGCYYTGSKNNTQIDTDFIEFEMEELLGTELLLHYEKQRYFYSTPSWRRFVDQYSALNMPNTIRRHILRNITFKIFGTALYGIRGYNKSSVSMNERYDLLYKIMNELNRRNPKVFDMEKAYNYEFTGITDLIEGECPDTRKIFLNRTEVY